MNYSSTISLDCPHCQSICQFTREGQNSSRSQCKNDNLHHMFYQCSNCDGKIISRWRDNGYRHISKYTLYNYYPNIGSYKPKIDLDVITNIEVKKDFIEAISCYNNDLYNSCMIMARRAIQQEMLIKIEKSKEKDNLYKQIESTGISANLKKLLQKVKNFGNYGAHPDFCLFDDEENKIEDDKKFAELSLRFLDKYFADQYETSALINSAPKSKHELSK